MKNDRESIKNFMNLEFPSSNQNAEIAKAAIAVLAKQMTPTPTHDDISNITTAVKEALDNAIIHAYPDGLGLIHIKASIFNHNIIEIKIIDKGQGMQNVQEARSGRSGMGFTIMEHFMTEVDVHSTPGKGTTVTMEYHITRQSN